MNIIKKIWNRLAPLPKPFRALFIAVVLTEMAAVPISLAAYEMGAMAVYEAVSAVEIYGILVGFGGVMTAAVYAVWS